MLTDGSLSSHARATDSPALTEEGGEVVNAIKLLVVLDWAETATAVRAPARRDLKKCILGNYGRCGMLMIRQEEKRMRLERVTVEDGCIGRKGCDWNAGGGK